MKIIYTMSIKCHKISPFLKNLEKIHTSSHIFVLFLRQLPSDQNQILSVFVIHYSTFVIVQRVSRRVQTLLYLLKKVLAQAHIEYRHSYAPNHLFLYREDLQEKGISCLLKTKNP